MICTSTECIYILSRRHACPWCGLNMGLRFTISLLAICDQSLVPVITVFGEYAISQRSYSKEQHRSQALLRKLGFESNCTACLLHGSSQGLYQHLEDENKGNHMLTHFITCKTVNDLLCKLKLKSRIGTPGKQSPRETTTYPSHLAIPGGVPKSHPVGNKPLCVQAKR